ncbi:MAG: response regulator [Oscillatoria sp. SIO1A7]|nr:response regulator [Oscillatoria sp. SIO1A7]
MSAVHKKSSRVLIVDDNPTNLKVLSQCIKKEGWIVLVSTDGESAIAQAEYAQPDLILLDVMMPGIDGFETCSRLKASPKLQEIPVIFMTALSDPVDKLKGLNLGAVDYITKPFQTDEVLARMRVHLELRAMTQKLEYLVEERTAKLKQALEDLKQSQVQLIQSEKMSALGQLVAGIAHEINNPVTFIDGNLRYAQEYISDLMDHLKLYCDTFQETKEIRKHAEEIDLEYLLEDLPKMIGSMRFGTERIRNISMSLRTFSRRDTTKPVPYKLEEGLDSTLLILKHRLKANSDRPDIEIIKEYGDLPEVKCYPGQLNQVFMNLIANAIDALDSMPARPYKEIKANPKKITIHTETSDDNYAIVRIKDNGLGMTEETSKKIFDYLFTTKPVGKGTGLGLSISSHIIADKHRGELSCVSSPGKGAEFIIKIPFNPEPDNSG